VTVGSGVSAEKPPRRIVSLVPSLTELLFALGVGDAVVGVTRYCTDPPARVAAVAKVGGTKNPDLDAIAALRPDLVVMNAEENRREDFAALSASGVAVLVTEPKTVDDGIRLIASLGAAVGRGELGAYLAAAQQAGVAAVRATVRRRRGVSYFCPIWRKPWMAFNADTYVHDVLRVAGGRNVLADRRERYPVVTLEEVAATAPEVVLLPDEPYRFAARDLPALAPLATTPALRHRAVRFIDGKALSWYGLRIADAVETFARVFAAAAVR
jgi:ABC-type Fe3+-hydroxamate transport system substrate-binding protein